MLKESSNDDNKNIFSETTSIEKKKDDLLRRILFITKSKWHPNKRFKWFEFIWSNL